MLPFRVQFKPGASACQQAVYAAKKSIIMRQLRPGDEFPSVRVLSQALKINPNTAHKVIAELTRDGLLEVRPGVGTVVAEIPRSTREQRAALLKEEIERLVVEAKRLSIDLDVLQDAVADHWRRLSPGGARVEKLVEAKL